MWKAVQYMKLTYKIAFVNPPPQNLAAILVRKRIIHNQTIFGREQSVNMCVTNFCKNLQLSVDWTQKKDYKDLSL